MTRGTKDASHLRATPSFQNPAGRNCNSQQPLNRYPSNSTFPWLITGQQGFSSLYFLSLTCHFIPYLSSDTLPTVPCIFLNLEFSASCCLFRGPSQNHFYQGSHLLCKHFWYTILVPWVPFCVLSLGILHLFSHSFLTSPLFP